MLNKLCNTVSRRCNVIIIIIFLDILLDSVAFEGKNVTYVVSQQTQCRELTTLTSTVVLR